MFSSSGGISYGDSSSDDIGSRRRDSSSGDRMVIMVVEVVVVVVVLVVKIDWIKYAWPKLWNELPRDIRDANTVHIFKRLLKTHLFRKAYLL